MSEASPRRQQANLNGITLSWLHWPDPQVPGSCSVVLLHGILQRASETSHIARHLSRYHQVVMPDLRGRGETSLPEGPVDPATIAADVAALIEHLELKRVVLIGRDHGGVVGYHLAARRPELAHGLVLGDSPPAVDQERADRRLAFVRDIPGAFDSFDHALAYYRDDLGVSEARARHDIPTDLREEGGRLVWIHNLAWVARVEGASAPRDDWDLLAGITAPTLVLRGQRSRISQDDAQRMADVMPHAEVQTIVGSGPDVFLGPGAEQTRGAIDMFLMRLKASVVRSSN